MKSFVNNDTEYRFYEESNRYAKVTAGGKITRIGKAEYEAASAECAANVEQETEVVEVAAIEEIKAEIPEIENAEAELMANVKKEKAAKVKKENKPRRPKDIAHESNDVTLTAKQVDFIHHLPDTCFWDKGLDSCVWVDCICDDIGGQFAGKPMTVGAMISTLCEKKLGIRATGRCDGRKCISFELTDLGKRVARELGLK